MNTNYLTPYRLRRRFSKGFTLVELLVVIAIIGILASIVIPNVAEYIYKGQVAKAVSEVRGIDTAISAMLSDTERSDFRNWFEPASATGTTLATLDANYDAVMAPGSYVQATAATAATALAGEYTRIFYELLRQGKNAPVALDLKPEIRQKLGNSYMDVPLDPWDQQYQFWIGPMRGEFQIFRSYRIDQGYTEDVEEMQLFEVYRYDGNNFTNENNKVPGAPKQDWDDTFALVGNNDSHGFYGFPAPRDLPVYVFSKGGNQIVDANAIIQKTFAPNDYPLWGGGDDINNWDNEQGWKNAPR